MTVNKLDEQYIVWGQQNFANIRPFSASFFPHLSANRFAGFPKSSTVIETSQDGGTTWTTINFTQGQLDQLTLTYNANLKTGIGFNSSTEVGTTTDMLRITLRGYSTIYTEINKIYFYFSRNGAQNCQVLIEGVDAHSDATTTSFIPIRTVDLNGWPVLTEIGFNPNIVFRDAKTSATGGQYEQLRFTFSVGGIQKGYDSHFILMGLMCLGVNCYQAPNKESRYGVPYYYDTSIDTTI